MDKLDVLKQCYIDGLVIKLPDVQLDRGLYIEIKNALELIGGKWKGGKTQGFVYKEDPSEYLDKLCSGESINLKKEFQFFATPEAIADRLVGLADIKPEYEILEPSAGQGAIINAVHKVCPGIIVDCFELMDLNRSFLEKLDNVNIIGKDFLAEKKEKTYDLIIANPPFSKNQDIDHFIEMYKCLKDNGRLISVMSNHWRFSDKKKEAEFYRFIENEKAIIYDLQPGDFKESGTNIQACIVVLDRKETDEENRILSILENASGKKKKSVEKSKEKQIVTVSESKKAEQELVGLFNDFIYRFNNSEVFVDFLDYALLVMKWWEKDRDFSYWEKKYADLYPKFLTMFEKLGIASDDGREGMHDALGDLFMELVSHGRNGQFFTPENICDMMTQMTCEKIEDGESVLDPACGSSRMLLAAAKRNRHVNLFGCDNDITCCKMSVLNLLLNSLTGEIAHMDTLRMEYHKSWFCYTKNIMGINYPMFEVIDDKEKSPLWERHMNTLMPNKADTDTYEEPVTNKDQVTVIEHPIVVRRRKRKSDPAQLMLDF